ncbi:MAG: hypothetical protein DRP59_12955 [Spirochaetes bacterium]|nr:MAG: hypothetical protein DRP59_12955 [Spirochaetota bacterium]
MPQGTVKPCTGCTLTDLIHQIPLTALLQAFRYNPAGQSCHSSEINRSSVHRKPVCVGGIVK